MKYLIASDIHGSATFCEELLDRFRDEEADRLILLGDLLYHGARNPLPVGYNPKRVAELLNSVADKVLCVRGNCDSEVDATVLRFPIFSEIGWLEINGKVFYFSHGHHFSKEHPFPMPKDSVFCSGHTHVPHCEKVDGILYANCGSVSLPKQNSPRSYIVTDGKSLIWKDIDGLFFPSIFGNKKRRFRQRKRLFFSGKNYWFCRCMICLASSDKRTFSTTSGISAFWIP